MRKYLKRNDIILILALMLVSTILTALLSVTGEKGNKVLVYVEGELSGEYPLNEEREISIEGYDGGNNILDIREGYARMRDASCPDKLCIHQGRISDKGQMIVCMPNRVVIEIEDYPVGNHESDDGLGDGNGYDAITQ